MLIIDTLTINSYDYQNATLEWTYKDPVTNISDYRLEVYISETPEPVTMFSGVNLNVSPTSYSYTDDSTSELNSYQFHNWYYRIKVVEISTPTNYSWSPPEYFSMEEDVQAKIMLKRKKVGIKKYGRNIKILKKRKIQGERCSCWDSTLGRSLKDDCSLCHGTGISTTGGYYDPISVKAAFNTKPNQTQITPFGKWNENSALMDILNYPPLSPDDLIIDQKNKRYKVQQVATFEKGQSLISQRCMLTLQEKSNEVYNVRVGAWNS